MKTLTFNCNGHTWKKGDKLKITRETKKTVQIINNDGTKKVFYKSLFYEY